MHKIILHLDMDAFFASIEQAVNPALREKPVIVGSRAREPSTVVAAASYEAKAFGVESGMSAHEAFRLCPKAVFVPADSVKYIYTSEVRQPTDPQLFGVNKKSWAALPDDLKILVESEFMAEALYFYPGQVLGDIEGGAKCAEAGAIIGPPPKDLEDALTEIADAYWAKKGEEDPFTAEIIDSLLGFKKASRGAFPRL